MKWLEIIEIRTTGKNREEVEAHFQKLMFVINREKKLQVKVYTHLNLDTDISIHIIHISQTIDKSGSSLALHIRSAMNKYGLINHSIWIEK